MWARLFISDDIELIDVFERQAEEIMFILPSHLAFCKPLAFGGRWRGVGDLGDKVCR